MQYNVLELLVLNHVVTYSIAFSVWNEKDCLQDLVSQLIDWSDSYSMSCNPSKCKELIFCKKGKKETYRTLGVTFQQDCRFTSHVKNKLVKASKCLHVLRLLRKEGFGQTEIDHLFKSIVLPNITYGLSVYGAADSELTTIQCFLDRCQKRRNISKHLDVLNLMEIQDKKIIKKVYRLSNHPLYRLMPQVKLTIN